MLFPPAPYSMSNAKKDLFLKVLKETNLPYGYASNIGRCVHVKERNFSGYKTHDAHVILHHLLQVAVRKTSPKNVAVPLTRLGNFFHGKLKSYVQNRSNPEGSIAEGCMMEKCLTFISRYLREGHPIAGKRKRKGKGFTLDFQSLKQAHRYIVFNCDNAPVETYIKEHQIWVNSQGRKRRWDSAQSHRAGGGEVRAVNINDLSDSEDVNNLEDDINYDDTNWDWMDATDDIQAHEP
uniref:DUF4218 domain-containing protein n=1 Tax=Chenopodium quinoa TaxID=63459 RepID=A0A803MIQ8_CHEQI